VYLDLSDFSHLFDWNTKQLFVLLAANYKTKKNVSPTDLILTIPCAHTGGEPVSWDKNMYITLHSNWETYSSIAYTHTQVVNQVLLWDKIIRRGDSPLVELHTAKSKYGFLDDGRGLL